MSQPPKKNNNNYKFSNCRLHSNSHTTAGARHLKSLNSVLPGPLGIGVGAVFAGAASIPLPLGLLRWVVWVEWKLQEGRDFHLFSFLLDLPELEQCLVNSIHSVNDWLNQSTFNRVANVMANLPGKGSPEE